jgi:hypothetical protein
MVGARVRSAGGGHTGDEGEEAERYWNDALANIRTVGDAWSEAIIDGERGWLLCTLGVYHEAAASLERSLRPLHEMNCMHDLCRFLPYVAGLAAASGQVADAARLYGGITSAYTRLGFTPKLVERARSEAFLGRSRRNSALRSMPRRGRLGRRYAGPIWWQTHWR